MSSLALTRNVIRAVQTQRVWSLASSSVRQFSLLHRSQQRSSLSPSTLFTASSSSSLSFCLRRHLFIQTQSTPNPLSLKFLPGREVLPAGSVTYDFSSYREASKVSPLAQNLFAIEGVKGVYLGPDFISVQINEGGDWNLIKPEIYAVITDFFAAETPVIRSGDDVDTTERRSSTTILPEDSEVVAMIKELIETRIRPAVQDDGGDIDYISFDTESGILKVQMQGSCKGCSNSSVTLKNGIENMLMHYVPEVKGVEEYIDEEVNSVSQEELKKLEERLAKEQQEAEESTKKN